MLKKYLRKKTEVVVAQEEKTISNSSYELNATKNLELEKILKKITNEKLFDQDFYLNTYEDVKNAKIDALQHYLEFGWREGRNPSENFVTDFYLENYSDVKALGINPLLHYVEYGIDEQRLPSEAKVDLNPEVEFLNNSNYFSKEYYNLNYQDVTGCPVSHFVNYGWKEGRNPSNEFNTNYYLEQNKDVQSSGFNPLVHWIKYGRQEGRKTNIFEVDRIPKEINHPSIIFISHEASETGAPAVLLSLMKWVKENTNINFSIIIGSSGPWNYKFESLAPTFYIDRPHTEEDIKVFCGDHVQCVYVNTIAAAPYAKALEFLQAKFVTHVHEMENVFKIFENQVSTLKEICQDYIAVSPGSVESIYSRLNKSDINLKYLKPFIEQHESKENISSPCPEKMVVFGCGAVEKRKGFDLFCQIGAKLKEQGISDIEMHWIGSEDNKDLRADETIAQFAVQNIVKYLGVKSYPRDYFKYGDVFLLTSREDPYPLVCMEAAELNLPVVCFDEKAGGMHTFVESDAGIVVPYLACDKMAETIIALASDEEKRILFGKRAAEKVAERHYVDVIAPKIFDFLPNIVNISGTDSVEHYKNLIETSQIVSFDIFDTLVTREFARPEVVFDIIEYQHTQNESGILSLFDERMKTAGKVLGSKKGLVDDVTIDDIYNDMPLYKNSNIEKRTEIDVCITHPVGKKLYDFAIQSGKKVYITSDMYLDRQTIEAILKKNGYEHWDAFFLSSEQGKKKDTGKLFEEVKAEANKVGILPEEILHIGDNWIGDVKFARKSGINAVRFTPVYESDDKQVNLTEPQREALSQTGRIWESFTSQATRMWALENPELKDDFYTKLGFELTGPLASMMAIHTKQLADKEGASKIIFMARDGRIIKKAFDALYKDEIKVGKYHSDYLHLSRATVIPATFEIPLSSNDIYFLVEGLHLAEKPIEYYLKKANLDPTDKRVIKKVEKYFESLSYIPNWSDFRLLSNMFDTLTDEIQYANEPNRSGLELYFQEKGVFDEDKVIIVDVGWLLNIQSRLANFFNAIGSSTQIIGSYVGSRERINKSISHSSLLYNMGDPSIYSKFLEDNVTLFEVLFSSPEPSAASITVQNGKSHLSLKSMGFPLSKEYVVAQKLHMGAEAYFEKLAAVRSKFFPEQISKDYFFNIFQALVNTDSDLAKAELGNFEVRLGGHHEFVTYQQLIKNDSYFDYKVKPKNEYFDPIHYKVSEPDKKYVIITSAGLNNGSTRYRALNFAESLQFNGVESTVLHSQTEINVAEKLISNADVIVFQRCFAEQGNVGDFLELARKYQKNCIGEIDDLVFPEHIESVGSVKGGEWNIDEARFVAESYEDFLCRMDSCIVSTPALKEYIQGRYKLSCKVVPNKISPSKIKESVKRAGALKLIYASGTYSHKEDFELIEEPLFEFLAQNPEVTLSILGATQSSERILSLPNVSSYPLLPYDAMLEFISKHDLMLVPLVDDVFNNAKSNIKFLEAGAVGVPVLVTNVQEFASVINDGENGFLLPNDFDLSAKISDIRVNSLESVAVKSNMTVKTFFHTGVNYE